MFFKIIDANTSTLFVRFFGQLAVTDTSLLYWIILLISLLMSISIHEFAHAYSAHLLGDDTAKEQDRMNINPMNHFDYIGLALILFTFFGYGKPVPVDPYNFKDPKKGFMLVSLAGPVSNLLIAASVGIMFILLRDVAAVNGSTSSLSGILTGVFATVVYALPMIGVINIGLAIFNLLPFYPLDGSKIWPYLHSGIEDFINEYITPYSIYILIAFILPIFNGISIIQIILLPFTAIYMLALGVI